MDYAGASWRGWLVLHGRQLVWEISIESAASLLATLSIVIGFVCCVLAVFLVATPSKNKRANLYFAIFLILTAIDVAGWLWVGAGDKWLGFYAVRSSLGTLQMPVFLFYIAAASYTDFRLTKWDSLHAIPFVLALALTFPGDQLAFMGGSPTAGHPYLSASELTAYIWGGHLQYYLYIAVAARLLIRVRRVFRQTFADARSVGLRWLSQLVIISFFAHTLTLARSVVASLHADILFNSLQVTSAALVLAIMTWITLTTLLQPDLFRGIDKALVQATRTIAMQGEAGKALDPTMARLLAHMDENAPYLNPELSVPMLADQLAMLPRELSELINQKMGIHFFDFVNGYRVTRAKKALLENREAPVLQILYDVGFNSKSSFNTAFKKHAGTTPSAYRRSHQPPIKAIVET